MSRFPQTNRASDDLRLRLPEGMRERLRQRAKENRRSMNAELVSIVERALEPGGKPPTGVESAFEVIHAGLLELLSVVQSQREGD